MRVGQAFFSMVAIFLLLVAPVSAELDQETLEKLKEGGEKINELIEKFKDADVEKYNRAIVSVHDEEGNPMDCTVRIYYNDFFQERMTTSGGKFDGVFNHGKAFPTRVLSIAVYGCPCWPVKMTINGPTFPYLNEELERIKSVLADELKDQASEQAGDLAEKGLEKVMEGLGLGAEAAGLFLKGFKIGADLGAPIGEFITKKIDEILDSVRKEAENYNELTKSNEPMRDHVNILSQGMADKLWPFGSWNKPTSQFEYDITLRCRTGFVPNEWDLRWYQAQYLKPKVPQATPTPQPPRTATGTGTRPTTTSTTPTTPTTPSTPQTPPTPPPAPKPETLQAPVEEKKCPECDPILDTIKQRQGELEQAADEAKNAHAELQDINAQMPNAERDLQNAKDALDRFNNPSSWAESEGRRVTSTDLEIQRQAMSEAWGKYKSGDWNAQQLEDYWKDFDPADRDELKQKAKERLERDVRDAQQKIDDLKKQQQEAQQKVKDLEQRMKDIQAEIERLKQAYEDCIKKCRSGTLISLTDYGIGVVPQDSFFDVFINLFTPKDDAPPSFFDVFFGVMINDAPQEPTREERRFWYEPNPVVIQDGPTETTEEQETEVSETTPEPDEAEPEPQDETEEGCPSPTMPASVCRGPCEQQGGTCESAGRAANGEACYACEMPSCPMGTTEDFNSCRSQCSGECREAGKAGKETCYQCVVPQCPSGTVSDENVCKSQCPQGDCNVASEQDGFSCWKCELNCASYCENKGYAIEAVDWTSSIESQLNQRSCVSGAQIRIPGNLRSGSCYCYNTNSPTITFDDTPPICRGTACGDVPCGETRECQISETQGARVSCDWSGWENIGQYQYRPIVGAQG